MVARIRLTVYATREIQMGAGTGFFVTETGVMATNAHVARGKQSLLTLLPEGQQLEAKVATL